MADRAPAWNSGDTVHTPFGKGVVQEVRSSGRVVVQVKGRTLLLAGEAISPAQTSGARRSPPTAAAAEFPAAGDGGREPVSVDLHGLTVEEALGRVDLALNDALLADVPQIRFIHGKSGGRIRAALHRHLRRHTSVRGFRLDAGNPGVTVVHL